MKRLGNSFAVIAMITTFVFGTAAVAQAQKRNDREIRDAVRSLSSKLDDFEYDLRYQMRSSSDNNGDVSAVTDDIPLQAPPPPPATVPVPVDRAPPSAYAAALREAGVPARSAAVVVRPLDAGGVAVAQ